MLSPGFENLSADQLRKYIETQEEKDYLIIDVRQPDEYAQAHIPGSQLIPLMQLESRLVDFPSNMDIVFYCRSGARSKAASVMAVGSAIPLQKIYNLTGGIMAWDGKTLTDFPRVKIFDNIENPAESLLKSMDLEKGALKFYSFVVEKYAGQPFVHIMAPLVKAERIHAQSIFKFWEKIAATPRPFDELFEKLKGDILEGGEKLEAIINRFETIEDNPCLELIELALNVEYAAYDLYRTMADRTEDENAKHVFLSIAQVEKSHMQMLASAIEQCPAWVFSKSGFKTIADIAKMKPDIEALKQKLRELDKKIEDVEKRLPAHSVKPPIMTELFELEDEREALLKKIAEMKGKT